MTKGENESNELIHCKILVLHGLTSAGLGCFRSGWADSTDQADARWIKKATHSRDAVNKKKKCYPTHNKCE